MAQLSPASAEVIGSVRNLVLSDRTQEGFQQFGFLDPRQLAAEGAPDQVSPSYYGARRHLLGVTKLREIAQLAKGKRRQWRLKRGQRQPASADHGLKKPADQLVAQFFQATEPSQGDASGQFGNPFARF